MSATIGDDDAKTFSELRRDVTPIGVTADGGTVNENDRNAIWMIVAESLRSRVRRS